MPTKVEQHYRVLESRTNANGQWGNWGSQSGVVLNTQNVASYPIKSTGNWRQRIAWRKSATTPFTGIEQKVVIANSDYASWNGRYPPIPGHTSGSGWRGNFSYDGAGPQDPTAYFIKSVQDQAIMAAVAKIRAAQTSLQGLVAAGEFGETVRMVNGAGRGLYNGVKDYLKSFDKKFARGLTPRQLTRSIGQRWIENVFGWQPFISDIDAGMKAFDRYLDIRNPTVPIRVQASSSEMNQMTRYSVSRAWYTIVYQPRLLKTYGYRIYGAVSLELPMSAGSMAHEFGIKLDEFAPTIWELIPFSFLADYFVNIGAVISASSLNTSSVAWLNYGTLKQFDRTTDVVSKTLQAPTGWITDDTSIYLGPPYRHRWTVKERGTQSVGSLIPSLRFQIPGSSTKWANMSALAFLHTDARLRLLP